MCQPGPARRPTATPTAARPASPPSTARSRPGCACARRPRRARRRSRAARRACGARARRSRAACRPGSTRPDPRPRTRAPRRRARAISSSICVDELGGVRHLVGPQHVEPVELRASSRPRTSRASSGSVVFRSRGPGDDLVLDVGDVAHVRDLVAAPPEVAADRVERRPPVRPCPRCGASYGVGPHTYIDTRPRVRGTKSTFARAAVS